MFYYLNVLSSLPLLENSFAEYVNIVFLRSQEWNYIPEETRRELGLTFDADGEFWMTFKDFTRNFQVNFIASP